MYYGCGGMEIRLSPASVGMGFELILGALDMLEMGLISV